MEHPLHGGQAPCYNAARDSIIFAKAGGGALGRATVKPWPRQSKRLPGAARCKPTAVFTAILLLLAGHALAQPQSTGVSAEAIGQANLRAAPSIEAALVSEIRAGTAYPVLGRSRRFPWLLLGEAGTIQPKGWVYEELVVLHGDINAVPVTEMTVNPAAPSPTPAAQATATEGAASPQPPTPGGFGVMGRVTGEVNIRYGPGVGYPRAGVAYAGDEFEVTGYHTLYPWLRIRYGGAFGEQAWVARDLLTVSGNIFNTIAISQTQFTLPPLTATPDAIRFSGINGEPAQPINNPGLRNLANGLWQLFLDAGFDPQTSRFGALFVLDLASGEAFSFGDDIAFSGTSLNKIAILAKLYQQLEAPPTIETTTDILNTMICSENAATNRLLAQVGGGNAYIGAEAVTDFLAEIGLSRSFLTAPFTTAGTPEPPPHPIRLPRTAADQVKAQPDLSNQLTVGEIGTLLANLYRCAYEDGADFNQSDGGVISGRECRQMLHVMSNNTVDALLKSGAPADTRVAHKHGWIPDTHGNAALFFTAGGDYVIAMMLFQPEWLNFQQSLPLFAEASRRVYNDFNPDAPFYADREWHIPDVNSCNYFNDPLVADLLQWTWDE